MLSQTFQRRYAIHMQSEVAKPDITLAHRAWSTQLPCAHARPCLLSAVSRCYPRADPQDSDPLAASTPTAAPAQFADIHSHLLGIADKPTLPKVIKIKPC